MNQSMNQSINQCMNQSSNILYIFSLEKLPASYNFKAIARDDFDAMNFGRKDRVSLYHFIHF